MAAIANDCPPKEVLKRAAKKTVLRTHPITFALSPGLATSRLGTPAQSRPATFIPQLHDPLGDHRHDGRGWAAGDGGDSVGRFRGGG
ncbi:hypothetical protein I41_37040 [Lacipirellula limnantheis]|uniref:Uncharacterized protein n=1 Tax=Lacipirellula limnantheis TaxID=2528024 RepID=A0A517U1L0_9BACT|nr:hypothetical protein I41_37040 [Lacipirellula limnantheis]